MLAGTLGSGLVTHLPLHEQGYVIIFSYMAQSMGMFISLLKLSVWMARNMSYPNPGTVSLPGYLMAVGPPGFTAFAYLNLGQAAVEAFPASGLFGGAADAGTAFLYISTFFALVFWGKQRRLGCSQECIAHRDSSCRNGVVAAVQPDLLVDPRHHPRPRG